MAVINPTKRASYYLKQQALRDDLARYAEERVSGADIEGMMNRVHAAHVISALDKWLESCYAVMTSEEQAYVVRLGKA